jgi:hypothetical protein
MPSEQQRVRLLWPFGGRDDRFAYSQQPPQTTVSARNVWPDSGSRQRGGSRPGFSKAFADGAGSKILGISTVTYVPDTSSRIATKLVVVDDAGEVLAGSYGGTLTSVGTISVSSSHTLSMCERNQLLYIAAHADVQATSESTNILKSYDPVAGTLATVTASAGLIPRGATCICLFRDRLVLAGGTTTPYGIYMSRQGEPEDWDYSETDEGAAVLMGTSDTTGIIGETVTSLTPLSDNCLVIGCPTTLWTLSGDPRFGGQLVNISPRHGVVDKNAWCTTPDGVFVFLSADGLYGMQAGCGGSASSISRERLPAELLNIDRTTASTGKVVSLAYDTRHRGIHIWVSDRTSAVTDTGNTHWFLDWETKSFWEVQYDQARFDPYCAVAMRNTPSAESVVMAGCRDGYVRAYDLDHDRDDDSDASTERRITSYVTFGPIGDEPDLSSDVAIDELEFSLSPDSGSVQWELYRGNSAAEAVDNLDAAQVADVGTLYGGRSPCFYPRIRGPSLFVKLLSTAAWTYEAGVALLTRIGRTRV